ncbi:hypothetical protein A5695_19800 [Mycobacterium sp. E1747]|nr:hypothetical protein A5695_19800 [Mycobacterium sp. E1747]
MPAKPSVPAPFSDAIAVGSPAVAIAPTSVAPAPAPASAPVSAPAPTATTVASSAPPAPPPPHAAGFAPPYVIAPPGIGSGSGMSTGASSSAKRKAPEPDSAAAAAAAAARGQARARRRRRATRHDHGDEFADINVGVDPDWGAPAGDPTAIASENGAGTLGFAGTGYREATAAGLATLDGDEFDGGPRVPMLPGSWEGGSEAR